MKDKITFSLPKKETLLSKGRFGGMSFYTEPENLFVCYSELFVSSKQK